MLSDWHPYLAPLLGGVLIGLAAWLLLAALGRVTGISGITVSAWLSPSHQATETNPDDGPGWQRAFFMGLVVMGALATLWWPSEAPAQRPGWLLVAAGLLVGFGTVWGSGCTSGHGVCGLGRRSVRSLVATLVFMATGAATVFVVRSIAG